MKRGRKQDDTLPPSRSREIQRAFRQRRSDYIQGLEKRVEDLQTEVDQILSQHGEPLRYAASSNLVEPLVVRKKQKTKSKGPLPKLIDSQLPEDITSKSNTSPSQSHPAMAPSSRPPTAFRGETMAGYLVDNPYEMHDYLTCVSTSHHPHSSVASGCYSTEAKPTVAVGANRDVQRSYSPCPFPKALDQEWDSPSHITSSTHSSRSSPFGGVLSHPNPPLMYPENTSSLRSREMYSDFEAPFSSQSGSLLMTAPAFLQRSVTAPVLGHPSHSIGRSAGTSFRERVTLPGVAFDSDQPPSATENTPSGYGSTEGLPFQGCYRACNVFTSPNDRPSYTPRHGDESTSPYVRSTGPMLQSVMSDSHVKGPMTNECFVNDENRFDYSRFNYIPAGMHASGILKPPGAAFGFRSSPDYTELRLLGSTCSESISDTMSPSILASDAHERDRVDLDVPSTAASPRLSSHLTSLCAN